MIVEIDGRRMDVAAIAGHTVFFTSGRKVEASDAWAAAVREAMTSPSHRATLGRRPGSPKVEGGTEK